MGRKRKRPVKDDEGRVTQSQQQPSSNNSAFKNNGASLSDATGHSHPVISLYYPRVVTLRQYILQRIPRSSKSRRRRIVSMGQDDSVKTGLRGIPQAQGQNLANFLDTTLVGISEELSPVCSQERRQALNAFTQAQRASQVNGTDTGPSCPQSEIVDYAISTLFSRRGFSYQRPQHLLTHGFQRASGPYENHAVPCSIPGIVAQFPNKNVQMLRKAPWTDVLSLLGNNGAEIMPGLLLDCGLFVAVDANKSSYCQISGSPLSTIPKLHKESPTSEEAVSPTVRSVSLLPSKTSAKVLPGTATDKPKQQGLNTIVFCRRRMLYARPHFNRNGAIQFGLTNHVLDRFPDSISLPHTLHVLKYIFPKQFSLHNVFTVDPSSHDSGGSRDYSTREEEIAKVEELRRVRHRRSGLRDTLNVNDGRESTKIPKRLRGKVFELVRQLQNRHKHCSYEELFKYYCSKECSGPWRMGPFDPQLAEAAGGLAPSASLPLVTQLSVPRHDMQKNTRRNRPTSTLSEPNSFSGSTVVKPKLNLMDHATPTASVSAFCQAVIRNTIPPQFYGNGQDRIAHQKTILSHVDRFVRMRRFESLSLHEVCAGIKVTHIPWLEPPNIGKAPLRTNISLSDLQKRKELFYEFIFYVFDSILIPLIRGNFYVTESQTHRNRLFYFRHDTWRQLTAEPLAKLKASMFEELKPEIAQSVLGRRCLGHGSLRLLPKMAGIRPILNLKRRTVMESGWAGRTRRYPRPSVNSTLAPIQSVLNYEKARNMDLLGSGMGSVGDMHCRLKDFKESLLARQGADKQMPLYFVKIDIQSCFDTIPQHNLVRLVEKLVSEESYHFMKYVEMRPGNEFGGMWSSAGSELSKIRRKFGSRVVPTTKTEHLTDAIARGGVSGRRNTVFIDTLPQKEYNAESLLDLLDEHVRNNLVKIGKKYFRQRNGIPQGSVLSSLLCNLFYAEMERDVLGFLNSNDALLLRLVDDFLLITLDSDLAMHFLQVMIQGQPAYGISVNPAKSLVNFVASVKGIQIPRLVDTPLFPYCGNLIDTRTLEISKDQDRILEGGDSVAAALSDSLTIESTRAPGRNFHRKILASLKLFMYPMYLDTKHNSRTAVLSNLYSNFITSAMRMYRYMRSLPGHAYPAPAVVVRTIRDVIQLGERLIRATRQPGRRGDETQDLSPALICTVSNFQVQYLAMAAFRFVLGRKQTRYPTVLHWLDVRLKEARMNSAGNTVLLSQVARHGNLTYSGWKF